MIADGRLTVHVWGFYDDAGKPRTPNGVAVSAGTVHQVHQQLERHIRHFGGELLDVRTTRTLDGLLVGTEFDSSERPGVQRMWHQVTHEQDMWPDKPEQGVSDE